MKRGVPVLVAGIETSCDETAVAIVEDGAEIRAERVASQERVHAPYGGVVPELASREHIRLLRPMLEGALEDADCSPGEISLIAATCGPGLAGCLIAGLSFAKGLAYALGIPLLGVNHIEAHIHSCEFGAPVEYPAVALVVSGGHTLLVWLGGRGRYRLLGQTRDDAVGEAYDKVASMLGLPFPGGPAIEASAAGAAGKPNLGVSFPRPLLKSGDFDFSFSGLKTSVLYWLKARGEAPLAAREVAEVARAFQDAAIEVLVAKAIAAARRFGARTVLLAGGVARNEALRTVFREECSRVGVGLVYPPSRLCVDNGVMVAALAYYRYRKGNRDDWSLEVEAGLRI